MNESFSRPVRDLSGFWVGNPILKNGAIEQLSLAGQEMAAAPALRIWNLRFRNWRREESKPRVQCPYTPETECEQPGSGKPAP